jgi:cardiolipin hydrolase
MHHKFAILDGVLLINGSFNWTRQASLENRENMMITNDKVFVDQFVVAFEGMWTDNVNFKDVK